MSDPLAPFRYWIKSAAAEYREFGSYASPESVADVISALEESRYSEIGKVCYVRGAGSLTRSYYSNLEEQPGVKVVYYESRLPWGLRFMASFMASYRGLVKIDDPTLLRSAFQKLNEQSIATIYVFDAALEANFVKLARSADRHRDDTFGVTNDPGYLIYLVDEDRHDSPTGMAEFLSYGVSAPWKDLFDAKYVSDPGAPLGRRTIPSPR